GTRSHPGRGLPPRGVCGRIHHGRHSSMLRLSETEKEDGKRVGRRRGGLGDDGRTSSRGGHGRRGDAGGARM
ncbi:hypothetical protein EI555_007556, partial [Monodon monoceros]